jgi:hypothetical protein
LSAFATFNQSKNELILTPKMTDTPGEYKIRLDLIGVFGAKSSYIIKIFLKDRGDLNKRKPLLDFISD